MFFNVLIDKIKKVPNMQFSDHCFFCGHCTKFKLCTRKLHFL